MRIEQIIERLGDIDRWNSRNGFGNRGLHPASHDMYALEEANERIAMAYSTLMAWENSFL